MDQLMYCKSTKFRAFGKFAKLKCANHIGDTGIFVKEHFCPEVPKHEIKMGEIEGNWQPAKFYCSEIKLIYSMHIRWLINTDQSLNLHRSIIDLLLILLVLLILMISQALV